MAISRIPSKEECKAILLKYNAPDSVIKHCLIVTEIAEEFCNRIPQIDKDIVIAGAMLHDIGRSIDHSIRHAIEGAKILQEEYIDQRIISIVKKHIGTGITQAEAEKLGLPIDDYMPHTNEEILVSYADNLACENKRCSFEKTLENFISKFGRESHVVKGFYRQKEIIESILENN
ncbi:HDIG domain-containing protein [Candidatus Heimdallarchaeota archaeon]|nr:MAG: HDIG domain-containing protein [Candidatus Heimdallarchaeota archaeon]